MPELAAARRIVSIATPCVGICAIDRRSGYCLGCARTAEEIGRWREGTEGWRRAVWSVLPGRFERLGIAARRLPWDAAETLDFIEESLDDGRGTWVLGVDGAIGEFPVGAETSCTVTRGDGMLEARVDGAAMRFRFGKEVRPMAIAAPGSTRQPKIVLTVHETRLTLAGVSEVADLGRDADAVRPEDRSAALFDLGLGYRSMRFCVRTTETSLATLLAGAVGSAGLSALRGLGRDIAAHNPTRVIETALGRMEVSTPIPPPQGVSPDGPHTHLLPDRLARGRETPEGLTVPDGFVVGAVFYPWEA